MVVASASISAAGLATATQKNSVEMDKVRARLQLLQEQANIARGLTAAPTPVNVQPAWTTVPPPVAPPVAQPVMVAASGSGASGSGAPTLFKMPAIIGELTSFKNQGTVGVFTPSMLGGGAKRF
jgi:hypothetical protein